MHTPSENRSETIAKVTAPPGTKEDASLSKDAPPKTSPEAPPPADSPLNQKPDGRKKAKKFLLFLAIALGVLLLLNLIPFDQLSEKAVANLPKETEPAVTYGEEFFAVPDYEEDVSKDEIYQKFNRLMTFSQNGEAFSVNEETSNAHGTVAKLFYDYFQALMAGDSNSYNLLFTDEYIEEKGSLTFAPQKVYDITVEVIQSEVLTEGDSKGNYKGYTVSYCEVAYKLRQNNGTLRRDFYREGDSLPQIFEVLEKDGNARINQISTIRLNASSNQKTEGGFVLMYIIWIVIMAAAIAVEAATTSLTAIWFMPAALVSLILALCNVSWPIQVLVFVVLSLVCLLIGTTVIKGRLQKKGHTPTNADRLIGADGIVTEEINNQLSTGEVKADGKRWSARSADGSLIEKDTIVRIIRIEGVKLICEKK